MFVIYGTTTRVDSNGIGTLECPACGPGAKFTRREVSQYATLYFVPIYKMSTLQAVLECHGCKGAWKPSVLTSKSLDDLVRPEAPPVAGGPPKALPPRKPSFDATWAWMIGFVCAAILLIVPLPVWFVSRYSYETSMLTTLLIDAAVGAFVSISVVAVGALVSGVFSWDSPIGGPRLLALPAAALAAAIPFAAAGVVGNSSARAVWQNWRDATLAAVDLGALDAASGPHPEGLEVRPPDDWSGFREWSQAESLHPVDIPHYKTGSGGAVVRWEDEGWVPDSRSLSLPDGLRADSGAALRWVAFVDSGRFENVIEYTNGRHAALGWMSVRIVDVASGRLIGHGAAIAGAPQQTKDPSSFYDLGPSMDVDLIRAAVQPSYASIAR